MYRSVSSVSQCNWHSVLNTLMTVRHHHLITLFIPVELRLSIPDSDSQSVSIEMIELVMSSIGWVQIISKIHFQPPNSIFLIELRNKILQVYFELNMTLWPVQDPSHLLLLFVQGKLLNIQFTVFGTMAVCKLRSCLCLKIQLYVI